ncbi:ribonuclease T2, partial [Collybia nuda]
MVHISSVVSVVVLASMVLGATLTDTVLLKSALTTYPNISSCLLEPFIYSCQNASNIVNSCCSPTPGGLVLQTQFWNTYTGLEKEGQKLPKGSWTIHGLWPDNCDGSFEQYCDLSRQYDPAPSPSILPDGTIVLPYIGPSVDMFVKKFGREDILEYMNKFWINQGAPNADLWAHEFSKHATCTSTFNTACYGSSYKKHQDLVNYFESTIRAFHQFPTYDILAAFGILPSNKTGYQLNKLQNAMKSQTGAVPFLGCRLGGTVLSEVWYFNHVFGTEQYGTYKPLDSTTISTCSTDKPIWYYERAESAEQDVR